MLLDDGMSCAAVAKVLLLDDGTIRTWHRLYAEEGIEGLASFGYEGSACRLSDEQHRLPGPVWPDRAAAPARYGASQAEIDLPQAGP